MNSSIKLPHEPCTKSKLSEAMILAVMNAILCLRREACKNSGLAMPVRRSNQLSFVATDAGSWSFVGSNVTREE